MGSISKSNKTVLVTRTGRGALNVSVLLRNTRTFLNAICSVQKATVRRVVALFCFSTPQLCALELELPSILADQMILQREQVVPIWGTAEAGAEVVVEFAGQKEKVITNLEGEWLIRLSPLEASAQSRQMKISATLKEEKVERVLSDILVGEVWLNSGQSNMYRPFRMLVGPAEEKQYEPIAEALRKEAAEANDPLLRQYRVGKTVSLFEEQRVGRGTWSKAVSGPVNEFCGTAYFFGKELRRELGVPVALLSCNLGATRIEPWISPQAFQEHPILQEDYQKHRKSLQKRIEDWDEEEQFAKYQKELARWEKENTEAKKKSKKPKRPEAPQQDKQAYGGLYNGMVHPLVPYAVKGALWYQGESNSKGASEKYGLQLTSLVTGWRSAWGQDKFYFYWCQLANYRQPNKAPVGDEDQWAVVQNGQREALALPDTGMAVLNDIGEARDIHPKNKIDAGKRLSLWALKQAYHQDLVCSGPLFKEARRADGKVIVRFDHVGSGLMVGRKTLLDPVREVHEELKRFQICGPDLQWEWATAQIVGKDEVEIWHEKIKEPVEVRYAWSSNPEGANLYNQEGLPASLFKAKLALP